MVSEPGPSCAIDEALQMAAVGVRQAKTPDFQDLPVTRGLCGGRFWSRQQAKVPLMAAAYMSRFET